MKFKIVLIIAILEAILLICIALSLKPIIGGGMIESKPVVCPPCTLQTMIKSMPKRTSTPRIATSTLQLKLNNLFKNFKEK